MGDTKMGMVLTRDREMLRLFSERHDELGDESFSALDSTHLQIGLAAGSYGQLVRIVDGILEREQERNLL